MNPSPRPDLSLLRLVPEVQQALAAGKAVVALESTIVAHGMPFPQNLETARAVEAVVRSHGGMVHNAGFVQSLKVAMGVDAISLPAMPSPMPGSPSRRCHRRRPCRSCRA